jgi:RHS repeat-associated protein
LAFSYDRYGNMTCIQNAQTQGPCPQLSFNSANRISTPGYRYDAAGNLTGDGVNTYQYDAEGRRVTINGQAYVFNALGQLVAEPVPWTTIYDLYDPWGLMIGRAESSGEIWAQQINLGERMMADYSQDNQEMYFIHPSGLGSTTVNTNQAGTATEDCLFYPWGQFWTPAGNPCAGSPWEYHYAVFDGRAMFRNYASNIGRWLTPDPVGGDLTNPQSLNRYAYVLNQPTTLTDPSGLDVCDRNPNARACTEPYPRDAVGGGLPPFAGLFGVDVFDLAAAGLLPTGPPSAALPGCGVQFVTCVQFAGGTVGFDSSGFADLSNVGDIASGVASGEPYTGGANSLFLFAFGGSLPSNLPQGTPKIYWKPFKQGFKTALKALKKSGCGEFLWRPGTGDNVGDPISFRRPRRSHGRCGDGFTDERVHQFHRSVHDAQRNVRSVRQVLECVPIPRVHTAS